MTVGGKQRRYLVYIPKNARPSTAGVFILPENGKTADDLWRDSWWRMIADTEETKEKLIVFFLEPENGAWNTEEPYGKADGDVAYVEQVYLAGAQRFKFCVHEAKFYLTGTREGGVIANMAAMFNPAVWAGVATVGGSKVPEDYRRASAWIFVKRRNSGTARTARSRYGCSAANRNRGCLTISRQMIMRPATASVSGAETTI